MKRNPVKLKELQAQLKGELFFDHTMRVLYATDASAYREMPLAVAIPADESDILTLIRFASENGTSLIPRTAGTSLAGQVVGNGIVVDVSRTFTEILEVNEDENWARVQPGVVRDVLNIHLKKHGLFYGPETSTANRAMIGGMVGNNSCGSNSVVYGSARDQLLEVRGYLSDGTEAVFKDLSLREFKDKCEGDSLEGQVYRQIQEMLTDKKNQEEIRKEFPKPSIPRRNTGYAVDLLLDTEPFNRGGVRFNFCKLIAGSEGTLFFIIELKLKLHPLPPKHKALVCTHYHSVDEALRANLVGLKYQPSASELIDHYILECTKENTEQRKNRFFVEGDPEAILVVELGSDDEAELDRLCKALIADLKSQGFGYHFPVLKGEDVPKIWNLRKAGLGLLSNLPGDAKPAPVIEDTAVDVEDLPAFIRDFNKTLKKYNLSCVHYAHAGSGELHLRPILNLKTKEGNEMFHTIADEIAKLVKRYKGSLSGEHGDGRLRGEFIPFMVGEQNYQLLKDIKKTWDPKQIFNPNKIVDTPKMNESLRYTPGQITPEFETVFDFSNNQGYVRSAELCNGSGDCRKTELSGGTMCPSYMATRNEKHTTRARANMLREMLTQQGELAWGSKEAYEVLDLCLSCKACKSECPSNVDMAKLKAEFLQHYYERKGVPFRTRLIAEFTKSNKLASKFPTLYNLFVTNPLTSHMFKKATGFATERSLPTMHPTTLEKWTKKHTSARGRLGKVFLFCDEFTNYNDTPIGITTVKLLEKIGFEVIVPKHVESGRTYLSKGLIKKAREIARKNVEALSELISEETPLVGIEPSTILTFRDEYIDLLRGEQKEKARRLAKNCLTVDEFLARVLEKKQLIPEQFTAEKRLVKLHGHCMQKSVGSLVPLKKVLSLPKNYEVQLIPSGCCGMAGSFGYEKEHYEVSMQIGELVLFPTVRAQAGDTLIVASGTSCRHQIKDGTQRQALHPVEVLWDAML
ncbi:MAG: FAD-binding protein [Cytophagales bacterium]|nr:FAD-binding protein [Cytophagales bacterium]